MVTRRVVCMVGEFEDDKDVLKSKEDFEWHCKT